MQTGKTLIRLGGCPGWSESSLGAHATLLVLSWGSSNTVRRSPGSATIRIMSCLQTLSNLNWSITIKLKAYAHAFFVLAYPHTCDTALIFRELPEMRRKISSKTYHFLPKFWNLPDVPEKCSYIFYTFFINLKEMKGQSPWSPFGTNHMYVPLVLGSDI